MRTASPVGGVLRGCSWKHKGGVAPVLDESLTAESLTVDLTKFVPPTPTSLRQTLTFRRSPLPKSSSLINNLPEYDNSDAEFYDLAEVPSRSPSPALLRVQSTRLQSASAFDVFLPTTAVHHARIHTPSEGKGCSGGEIETEAEEGRRFTCPCWWKEDQRSGYAEWDSEHPRPDTSGEAFDMNTTAPNE